MDLVVFDQKIFEVPHGIFLFCLGGQLSLCISLARSVESRIFDRLIRTICEKKWPQDSLTVYKTYPNENVWLETTSQIMHSLHDNSRSRILFSFVMFFTTLLMLVIIVSPITIGMYYIYDWKVQISTGWIDFQYYLVLASTCLSLLWFINYVAVHMTDHDDTVA